MSAHHHGCEATITLGSVAQWWSTLICLLAELLNFQFSEFDWTVRTLTRKKVSPVRWQPRDGGGGAFYWNNRCDGPWQTQELSGGEQVGPGQQAEDWLWKTRMPEGGREAAAERVWVRPGGGPTPPRASALGQQGQVWSRLKNLKASPSSHGVVKHTRSVLRMVFPPVRLKTISFPHITSETL